MATNYERGRDTEYKCIETLEKAGYIAVRTAGSHGAFDVVAVNALGFRLIQCKREQGEPGSYDIDREKIQQLQLPRNATGELWVWRDRQGWVLQEVVKAG